MNIGDVDLRLITISKKNCKRTHVYGCNSSKIEKASNVFEAFRFALMEL